MDRKTCLTYFILLPPLKVMNSAGNPGDEHEVGKYPHVKKEVSVSCTTKKRHFMIQYNDVSTYICLNVKLHRSIDRKSNRTMSVDN
jgi:hypothetical protein